MEIEQLNKLLAEGIVTEQEQFPHLKHLETVPYRFKIDFGLKELPEEAGILLIRGARMNDCQGVEENYPGQLISLHQFLIENFTVFAEKF